MNVFLIVVGILAIIAGIVGPIIVTAVRKDRRGYGETVKPVKKTAWIAILLVGILMFTFGNAFVIIPLVILVFVLPLARLMNSMFPMA